jgi:hypothetical protein
MLEAIAKLKMKYAGKHSAPETEQLDVAQTRLVLENLRDSLARFDLTGAEAALKELARAASGSPLRAAIEELRHLIDGYDYEQAGAVLARLLAKLTPEGQS